MRETSLHQDNHGPMSLDSDMSTSIVPAQWRRSLNEVQKLGDNKCSFTTSLETDYNGQSTARGTMFTIRAKADVEVLTVEFDAEDDVDNLNVQVYFRPGDFSGVTNNPGEWQLLAATRAEYAPNGHGVVVPTNEFEAVTIPKGTTGSFYIHLQENNVLKQLESDRYIGEEFARDDARILVLQAGVYLDDGPFPEKFGGISDFTGRIHYKAIRNCDEGRTTSSVNVEFAVNVADPTEEIMEAQSELVEGAVITLLESDPGLKRMKEYHMLELQSLETHFVGRSEEKCPQDFDLCTELTTSVVFKHLQTLEAGELQYQLLEGHEMIGATVSSESEIPAQYVGPQTVNSEFVITLRGVPPGSRMNALQRNYYERMTTSFLQAVSEVPIYMSDVVAEVPSVPYNATDEISEGTPDGIGGDDAVEEQGIRKRQLGLRGTRRAESVSELQVVTNIWGGGSVGEVNSHVVDTFATDARRYVSELSRQQLRPGEINEDDSGSMFASVAGIRAIVKPDNFGEIVPDVPPDDNTMVIICLVGIFIALVALAARFYFDTCYAPTEKLVLPKLASNGSLGSKRRERPWDDEDLNRSGHEPRKPKSAPFLSSHPNDIGPNRPRSNSTSRLPTDDGPRNRAGDNGRGVQPSRSMPLDMMNRPPQRRPSTDSRGSASSDARRRPPKSVSDLSRMKHPPRNQTGQERGPPSTRSLPDLQKHPPRRRPSGNNGRPRNRAGENGRGLQPSRSTPGGQRPPTRGDDSDFESSDEEDRRPAKSSPNLVKHPPRNRAGQDRDMSSLPRSPPGVLASARNKDARPLPPGRKPSPRSQHDLRNNDPRNRAGENGRGVQPSRSMPSDRMAKPANRRPAASFDSDFDSSDDEHFPAARSTSNLGEQRHPPQNQAGQRRGIAATKSMPMERRPPGQRPGGPNGPQGIPTGDRRGRKPQRNVPPGNGSRNPPGDRRGVQPTRSLPRGDGARNQPAGRRGVKPTRSLPGRGGQRNQPGDGGGVQPTRMGRDQVPVDQPPGHPRNQAGQRRGIAPSKSMPTGGIRPGAGRPKATDSSTESDFEPEASSSRSKIGGLPFRKLSPPQNRRNLEKRSRPDLDSDLEPEDDSGNEGVGSPSNPSSRMGTGDNGNNRVPTPAKQGPKVTTVYSDFSDESSEESDFEEPVSTKRMPPGVTRPTPAEESSNGVTGWQPPTQERKNLVSDSSAESDFEEGMARAPARNPGGADKNGMTPQTQEAKGAPKRSPKKHSPMRSNSTSSVQSIQSAKSLDAGQRPESQTATRPPLPQKTHPPMRSNSNFSLQSAESLGAGYQGEQQATKQTTRSPKKHPPIRSNSSCSVPSVQSAKSLETGQRLNNQAANRPTRPPKKHPPVRNNSSCSVQSIQSTRSLDAGQRLKKTATKPYSRPPKKHAPVRNNSNCSLLSVQSSKSLDTGKQLKQAPRNRTRNGQNVSRKMYPTNLDSDSSVDSPVRKKPQKHLPVNKAPVKPFFTKHTPRTQSLESLPENQSGKKGRGIAASRSLPTVGSNQKPLTEMVCEESSSDESSSYEEDFPPRKIHPNRLYVDDNASDVSSITASGHGGVKGRGPPEHNGGVNASRLAKIRSRLRDTSAPPVDLTSSILRPSHLREKDDWGDPGGRETRQ